MASYTELYGLISDSTLRNRITVAIYIEADTIRLEEPNSDANHANRLLWAKQAWLAPEKFTGPFLAAALAQNKTLTTAQITGASDAALQLAIKAVVNIFATGE